MNADERAEQLRLDREQYLRGPANTATARELQHRVNQRRAGEAREILARTRDKAPAEPEGRTGARRRARGYSLAR
jgi:hypothetical protein